MSVATALVGSVSVPEIALIVVIAALALAPAAVAVFAMFWALGRRAGPKDVDARDDPEQ